VDDSGSDGCVDGCVGVSSPALALALGDDDTLADPDTDGDTDAERDPDVAVAEGRLGGSGDGTLLAGALRLEVGTGTDGAGTAGWVSEGDGEADWSGARDDVAVDGVPVAGADGRPDAVLVGEGAGLDAAGLVAEVPGSPPPDGAVLAAGAPASPDGADAGAGRPGAVSGGREPDLLVDRVGADASRPTPPVGTACPAGLAGTAGRIPPTSTAIPVASAASVLTAISAIAAPGRAFV